MQVEADRFPPGHREMRRGSTPSTRWAFFAREQWSACPALYFVDVDGGVAIAELRVNGAIRAKEVRVVAPDGEQIGIKETREALWLAEQLGLDLVEVAPNARPPVCRLMDYGKYKYEQSVKDREARKKQTRTVIKEVRMRPGIGKHDYEIVRRRAEKFLMHGDRVKVALRFRGRENERPEFGAALVTQLVEDLGGIVTLEQAPRKEGRMMHAVLAPNMTAINRLRKEQAAQAALAAAEDGEVEETLDDPTGQGAEQVALAAAEDGEVEETLDDPAGEEE
jgi:translation initiation factor IF-3